MSKIIVDVEADGQCPGLFSMISFGAIVYDKFPEEVITFYGKTAPISNNYEDQALAVSGTTREEHKTYPHPTETMKKFAQWIITYSKGKPIFISDNVAFDWQFINYYFHLCLGYNPFGHSGKRIGDIYAGLTKNMYNSSKWKNFRKTKHTHNPVDDVTGVAEALYEIKKQFGVIGL